MQQKFEPPAHLNRAAFHFLRQMIKLQVRSNCRRCYKKMMATYTWNILEKDLRSAVDRK
jgi:hypothetical protein